LTTRQYDDTELDHALALTPEGDGRFGARLGEGWTIGHAVNGGVLLALAGRALQEQLGTEGHPDPLVVSAFYLSAATPGPATLVTEQVRSGRTMATGQASILQPGPDGGEPVERVRAMATFGDLAGLPDDVRTSAEPPQLPDPDACVSAAMAPKGSAGDLPFLHRFDMRLDPDTVGWAMGAPSHRGVIQGWLRMADGREPDPLMLLLAVDTLPPVTFDMGLAGWAPTLELSAHVRAVPAPGWLRVRVSTRNLAGGLLEEDAEVWDSQDRLVAQARQLARVPRR
jgi:acyl-coenzyme A thioesterase PaaI-like protein